MTRTSIRAAALGSILFVAGCSQPLTTREKATLGGAAIGAGTGAAIGSASGNAGTGAAIGAGAGALGGFLVGDHLEDDHRRHRRDYYDD